MTRQVLFSERPGRHERHFRRRLHPLFPRPVTDWGDNELLEVQRRDHEELLAFITSLRGLVRRAVELGPSEESQVVLDLKADLEKHYEEACGLADAQGANKQAIKELIEVIMKVIRRGAAGDSLAERELAQEEEARRQHFELLETPLVADLLHPRTLIESDELVPVLLTDPQEQVAVALDLFDEAQRRAILGEARRLLEVAGESLGEDEKNRLSWLEGRFGG